MHQKWYIALISGALVLIAGFSGYAIGKNESSAYTSPPAAAAAEEEAEAARPQIFVENSDSDTEFHEFTAEELGIAFDGKVSYSGLSQVNIQIGDTVMPLEDALKNGEITVEALIADIRLDAEDKVCRERTASKLGLSRFIYQYRDFDAEITYDVYETPAKGNYIIRQVCFYPPGHALNVSHAYSDDDHPGEWIDRENWGISLKSDSVTPGGMVLECLQSGGQQIGTLHADYFMLFKANEPAAGDTVTIDCSTPLTMGGTCEITLDWSDTYGELSSGDYAVFLLVRDEFDESQVHPLMRDFKSTQYYVVEFAVP